LAADVVEGLVVDHERHVGVLEQRVRREHAVVRLDDRRRHLGRRVDGEGELGLAAVVDGEALEEEGAKAGASAATNSVEDEEALEASAVVSELADAVEDEVDDLLADGVVATSVVVSSIFLAGDKLFRVVQLTVGASAHLIDHSRLKVHVHAARHVLASTSLREKGVERVVAAADGLVRGHLAVRLDAVLKAVKFPTGVAHLDSGLAEVDVDALTHFFV
jgi:hypothetical protein